MPCSCEMISPLFVTCSRFECMEFLAQDSQGKTAPGDARKLGRAVDDASTLAWKRLQKSEQAKHNVDGMGSVAHHLVLRSLQVAPLREDVLILCVHRQEVEKTSSPKGQTTCITHVQSP